MPPSPRPKDGGSRLSRMVASKGAVITMGTDRRIAADQADFDAKADTALFIGNVLVNQQKNVLQGRRLFVDRKNNKSRLDSPAEGGQPVGRITATLVQGEGKAAQPAKPKSAAAEVASAVGGDMLGTFKADPNAPMDIEANTLDIFDATKQAVFRTNVKAQQGDLVIRTVELTAHYTGPVRLRHGRTAGDDGKGAASQLTRVDAREKVLITSKDGQTATGDWATFDVKANTVLLVGHVVVSRGKDVAEGPRLKIDLTTGMYRFEVENEGGAPRPSTVVSAGAAQGDRPRPVVQHGRDADRAHLSARQAVPAVLPAGCQGPGQGADREEGPDRRRRGLAAEHQRQLGDPGQLSHDASVPLQSAQQAASRRQSAPGTGPGAPAHLSQRPPGRGRATRKEIYGGPGWLTAVNVQKSYAAAWW